MNGWLRVVGLGPGAAEWVTPEAYAVLHEASDIVGYAPYVESVPATVTARRHASGNGVELDRARQALQMAASGRRVALVSGGDAGVFGMAAALFEAMEKEESYGALDVEVVPGVTALLAVAARAGAPLGHDFCVISLSDYLKPWAIIEKRLKAASEGDFVVALYNPASKTRRDQLVMALDLIRQWRGPETVAIVAASIGRLEERMTVTTLQDIDLKQVDMRTLVMIGSSRTRCIGAHDRKFVYTPRSYEDAA